MRQIARRVIQLIAAGVIIGSLGVSAQAQTTGYIIMGPSGPSVVIPFEVKAQPVDFTECAASANELYPSDGNFTAWYDYARQTASYTGTLRQDAEFEGCLGGRQWRFEGGNRWQK